MNAYRDQSRYYFRAPLLSPDYDAEAVCAINRGSVFTLEWLLPEFLEVGFTGIESFSIPVLMFIAACSLMTLARG